MSKLFSWAIPALLVVIGLLVLLYGFERHSAVKARAEATVATQAAQTISQQLTEAHESFRVDLDAISKAEKAKSVILTNATKAKEKVDDVAAKVEANQLTPDASDAAYYNVMWEVYCQGSPDPACATPTVNRADQGTSPAEATSH